MELKDKVFLGTRRMTPVVHGHRLLGRPSDSVGHAYSYRMGEPEIPPGNPPEIPPQGPPEIPPEAPPVEEPPEIPPEAPPGAPPEIPPPPEEA